MPVIEQTKLISAPIDKVFAIARDSQAYPEYMPDVKSLEVISTSEDGNTLITRWVGRIPQFGMNVKWTQEETWIPAEYSSKFKQTEGDYDKMEGWWKFTEENGQTKFQSWLEYEYNVPMVGPLLHKVVRHIVEQNIDRMMDAIKHRAESG
jgi:ribosome-associated toxin RatA of RatAB toxin-antitoxin module